MSNSIKGKNTSMNIRMDRDVKEKSQIIFKNLGMDTTTAVNIFLRQVIRTNGIPFKVVLDEPNDTTKSVIKDAAAGNNLHGPFNSIDDLMEDLNA